MAVLLSTQDKPLPAIMKSKALLVLLVVAMLVLLVAYLIRPTPQTALNNPPTNAVTEAPNPTPSSEAVSESTTTATSRPPPRPWQPQKQNVPDAQGNWASEPLPPGSNLQDQLEELARRRGVPLNVLTQQAAAQWSNAVQQMAQDVNRTIDFHGKVVDESDHAIVGANVDFGCVQFPETHFATNAQTDALGLFELHGVSGAILTVRVSKQGYEEISGTNQITFSYYSPLPTGGFKPDPNNPVVFHLRKKE